MLQGYRNFYAAPGLIDQNKRDPEGIKKIVCLHFKITEKELTRKCRRQPIVLARQITQTLIRRECGIGLKKIGKMFRQHHSSVIHSIATIDNLVWTHDPLANHLTRIKDKLLLNH